MHQNFDFNLFRLINVLFEERSVTRAAERLCLTPSAVSHALKRLRYLLSDPLFVRGPGGMVPTPRAEEIASRLHVLLPQLHEALSPSDFDAGSTERRFALACLPYLTALFIPRLAASFGAAAPNAELDVRQLHDSVVDELDSGRLDLAIGNFRRVPERLTSEDLLIDDSVWVIRRSHPIAARPLTLEQLSKLGHVDALVVGGFTIPVESYDVRQGLERQVVHQNLGATDAALLAAGLSRKVRLRVPDSFSVMMVVAQTDTIGLVPQSMAFSLADALGLAILKPPYPTAPLVMQMLYHSSAAKRPAIAWLLGHIRDLATSPGVSGGGNDTRGSGAKDSAKHIGPARRKRKGAVTA